MNARLKSGTQDTPGHSVSSLQEGSEKVLCELRAQCASLADELTHVTQASAVHDRFRTLASVRLKYLEEDWGRLMSLQSDGWAERLKRLEMKAQRVETQAGAVEEQAGQLEEINRKIERLWAASEKHEASWEDLKYVIAGDLHRLAEGTAGSVGDLQTNGWLRQTGGTGRSDTGIRPTLHSPVVQVHTQRLQNTICIMETECEYVLKDSVWDASIFMMCRFFPSQEMYLFLAAVVLNLVLQVILCATVMHLGGEGSDYSDSILADFAIWAEGVDEVERQKVCSGSYSLSTSTLQWYSGIVG